MNQHWIFLSHLINSSTPTYGNRNRVELQKKSSISLGDAANDTHIATTVHIGTHIDFPCHFYPEGQTFKDYRTDFWVFTKPLFLEIEPRSLIIEDELIDAVKQVNPEPDTDILLVKTGFGQHRTTKRYWNENPGFSPSIYDFLQMHLPMVRIMGFDTISVSSFQHRNIGREAHLRFLNPKSPVLLLEDMNLINISSQKLLTQVIVSPLPLENSDGAPCMVLGKIQINK